MIPVRGAGTSQAENERDRAAIAALRRCLQLEPGNGAASQALAVSLTNEGNHHQAVQALEVASLPTRNQPMVFCWSWC